MSRARMLAAVVMLCLMRKFAYGNLVVDRVAFTLRVHKIMSVRDALSLTEDDRC